MAIRLKVAVVFVLALTTGSMAQTVSHPADMTKNGDDVRPQESLQSEIEELRQKIESQQSQISSQQSQINGLKQQLQDRDAELQQPTSTAVVQRNASVVASLQGAVSEIRTPTSPMAPQALATQKPPATGESPAAIHYKGISIEPGGFLAGENIWRQRAMNADIYTNFNATPYMNSGEAHTSEWVPSARQSRPTVLFSGNVPFGTIGGYFEGDFLSAGITSNNLQSNSYTLRVRQAWAQATTKHLKFTGGEMWTLLTEDKKSADPGQEAFPFIFDGNTHVGFTYLRQPGFRLEEKLKRITLAMALENSQYQFSASNAPSNFFFGAPGAVGGLNNPTANYTNQVAPDVLAKITFDAGRSHYELGGVARFFRDRYYPGGSSAAGATNDTVLGGGLVANARFSPTHLVDIGLHLVAGDGTGRYGPALLPDITVKPDGTLEPIRNAQALFSVEIHPSKRFDVFSYLGTEYAQRTFYKDPSSGMLVGYAPPTASNVGCSIEAVPTTGTGYAPGSSPCLGATRDISQYSFGWVYRLYNGPAGRLQYGMAYSYLNRVGWVGEGGAPKAVNNLIYTSARYYIP